jgi:type I restriction enzyme M protein
MRVYDPCSASGGMLILSHEYVQEHGGNPRDLALYGQGAEALVQRKRYTTVSRAGFSPPMR